MARNVAEGCSCQGYSTTSKLGVSSVRIRGASMLSVMLYWARG
jgi:hypothetical protein